MFPQASNLLRINHNRLTIADSKSRPLLADCTAAVQLSNGVTFALDAMESIHHTTGLDAAITAGGDRVLPRLEWRAAAVDNATVSLSLQVTNTTNQPLPIERLDVLICPHGYQNIATDKLYYRRTGWQSFSPAHVSAPFSSSDPWLQPPLYAPMIMPSNDDRRQVAWMTILQSRLSRPLLAGFTDARNYLGLLDIGQAANGHRLTASSYVEGVELPPGKTITSEPLFLTWGDDQEALLGHYARQLAANMRARKLQTAPTGWCSWNYYFHRVTASDISANLKVMSKRQLPFKIVQIDDGYQTKFGDWLDINDQFPEGMKAVADQIRQAGYTPGIWIAPFMAQADSKLFQQHPDWFIRDDHGRPFNVNRHGDQYWTAANYGLDLTHPQAYAWITAVFETICHDWGFDYIKVDYLYAGCQRGLRHDPSLTSVQAFRRGLDMIRRVAGKRILLGCGTPLLPSVGIFDAMRVSADIMPSLPKNEKRLADVTRPLSRDNIASFWSHAWMNGRLWVNDPDTYRVRQHNIESGWEEIKGLAVQVALTGGSTMDSDNLTSLEPEGFELMDRLYPVAKIRSRAVGRQLKRPGNLIASVQRGNGSWHIVARYNWHSKPAPFRFAPSDWELPLGRYHAYDLIKQQYLGIRPYQRADNIAQYGVAALCVCAVSDQPQVIATAGHLLGPAGDVADIQWSGSSLTIRLADNIRPGRQLIVHIPRRYELTSLQGGEEGRTEGRLVYISPTAPLCTLSFRHRLKLSR